MKIIVYIFTLLMPYIAVAQDTAIAEEKNGQTSLYTKAMADSLYATNNYLGAIEAYENIIEETGANADIYYNLGNAYYKEENIAKSILNYERALLLDPSDSDIKFNLLLAKNKTIDKESEPYEIFFMQWIKNIINILPMTIWTIIAIVTFIILLVSLSIFLFTSKIGVRRTCFIVALITLFTTIFANLAALHHYSALTNRTAAIIMHPSVTAKSTPDTSGTDLFIIHEGRKVTISDDTMKGWKEIELEDGTIGWIPANTIEKI